jgi:hypothetical protein
MLYRWFLLMLSLLILGCCFAGAQTTGADSKQAPERPDVTTTGVAPNDAVETIHGFCDNDLVIGRGESGSAASWMDATAKPGSVIAGADGSAPAAAHGTNGADCEIVVTRAEFEKLVTLLQAGGIADFNRSNRIKFAVRYPETLLFAEKALQAGLDKDPGFQAKVEYTYLTLLAQAYTRQIQEKATNISDEEFASEYNHHPELFEKVDLLRIFVPKQKVHTSGVEMLRDAAADEAAMKAEAQQIRKKAVAGVSFARLQKEVYAFAGEDPEEAPSVELNGATRIGTERQYQDVVFHLKPGEISEPVAGPKGWSVFKLVSKSEVPRSEAKNLLLALRTRDVMDAAKAEIKTDFNDAYFNVPGGMEPAKPDGVATKSGGDQSQ